MGLRINLPQAELLGISGVTIFELNQGNVPAALSTNSIYILGDDGTNVNYTVTLPTTVATGEEIILKKVGGAPAQVQVTSARIEGTDQTIEINNNQPVRLIFHNATFGWLLA